MSLTTTISARLRALLRKFPWRRSFSIEASAVVWEIVVETTPPGSSGHRLKLAADGHIYPVPRGVSWKNALQSTLAAEMNRQGLTTDARGPFAILIDLVNSPTDWDNVAKSVGDAGNNTVYLDDKQVLYGRIAKRWEDPAGARIVIRYQRRA